MRCGSHGEKEAQEGRTDSHSMTSRQILGTKGVKASLYFINNMLIIRWSRSAIKLSWYLNWSNGRGGKSKPKKKARKIGTPSTFLLLRVFFVKLAQNHLRSVRAHPDVHFFFLYILNLLSGAPPPTSLGDDEAP